MASIRVRLDRLERRHGGGTIEDQLRHVPTAILEQALEQALKELQAMVNAGQADEGTVAEIEAIEGRYR
jgi:hypothetical protein